jgi:threonine dehydrogenase-like Zn-dependent dehydrogenase
METDMRKTAFAVLIACGFIGLTAILLFVEIPAENVKTVDGAMVALGTALGAAVMALLRNSHADEVKAENTGKALDVIAAATQRPDPAE